MIFLISLVVLVWFGSIVLQHSRKIKELERKVNTFSSVTASVPSTPNPIQNTAPLTHETQGSPLVPPLQEKKQQVVAKNTQQSSVHEDSSGKILGRLGIGAVILGVIFFLKYAFDNDLISEAGRIILGLIAGAGMFVGGNYLYKKYQEYGALLMGGGVIVVFLSIFSAYNFYDLISYSYALTGFVIVSLVSALVSLVHRAQSLLVLGMLGVYTAPFIFEKNNDALSIESLGVYMVILTAVFIATLLKARWLSLNYIPLVATALIYGFKVYPGIQHVNELHLLNAVIIGVVLLTLYAGTGVYALISAKDTEDQRSNIIFVVLSYILWGAFIIVTAQTQIYLESYLGYIAIGLALHAGSIAVLAHKAQHKHTYVQIILAGIVATFVTIAVPLQFDGVWVGVSWVVEALIFYILAHKISDRGFQVMGAFTFAFGAINIVINEWSHFDSSRPFVPILNIGFFSMLIAVVVAGCITYIYYKYGSTTQNIQKNGVRAFFIVTNILILITATSQISKFYSYMASSAYTTAYSDMQTTLIYSGRQADNYEDQVLQEANNKAQKFANTASTVTYIFYAVYAAFLIIVGFVKRIAGPRKLGFILFILTAVLTIVRVWSLGPVYRIIASIGLGILALIVSFLYSKYKNRIIPTTSTLALMLVIGLATYGTSVYANYEANLWQFSNVINVGEVTEQKPFVEVMIPPTVTDNDPTGASIRVIRNGTEEVSYATVHRTLYASEEVRGTVLDTSTRDGVTYARIDTGGNGVYSGITLKFRNKNFNRQVKVFASDSSLGIDSPNWRKVTDSGYVYAFYDEVSGQQSSYTTVSLPKMSSRYLLVQVVAGTEGALILDGVRIESTPESMAPRTFNHVAEQKVTFDEKTKATIITSNLGRLYNVGNVTLGIQEGNYSRLVTVETSADGIVFTRAGQGRVYSITSQTFTGKITTVEFSPVVAKYLRIIVANGDSAPLTYTSTLEVSGPLSSIIFDASREGEYRLVFGNPRAEAPIYDTQELARFISAREVAPAYLDDIEINPNYIKPSEIKVPFAERYPHALNITLGIIILASLGVIVQYFRKYHTQDTQNSFESNSAQVSGDASTVNTTSQVTQNTSSNDSDNLSVK